MYPPPWWEVRPWWLNSLPWWLATPRSTGVRSDEAAGVQRRKELVASLQAHPHDSVAVHEVPELPVAGDPLLPGGVLGGPLAAEEGETAKEALRKSSADLSPSTLYGSTSAVGREFGVGGPAAAEGRTAEHTVDCDEIEAKQKDHDLNAPSPDGALDHGKGEGGKPKRAGATASECQKERGDTLTHLRHAAHQHSHR